MPTSKQARARQNRQKQRVASAYLERDLRRRRQRRIGATLIVLAMVLVIALAFTVGSSGNSSKTAASTPTSGPATTNCVKFNDTLPKGAPSVPVPVGPAPTKLVVKDLETGTGAVVKPHAKIEANYIGVACSTGKIFDSSYSRGKATPFGLDQVIPGWQQGIPGMKLGGMRLLGIPSDLAYGATGQGSAIGPNEALWFVVQPVKIDG
jgi:peptidylprolyl isomerase